ncbi:hypothetical protein CapIbe_008252 [Capra ibex]
MLLYPHSTLLPSRCNSSPLPTDVPGAHQLLDSPWGLHCSLCQDALSMAHLALHEGHLPLKIRGIFPTQRSNPHLLHQQVDSLPLSHLENPTGDIKGTFLKTTELEN